jgi:hypothetical protein
VNVKDHSAAHYAALLSLLLLMKELVKFDWPTGYFFVMQGFSRHLRFGVCYADAALENTTKNY